MLAAYPRLSRIVGTDSPPQDIPWDLAGQRTDKPDSGSCEEGCCLTLFPWLTPGVELGALGTEKQICPTEPQPCPQVSSPQTSSAASP